MPQIDTTDAAPGTGYRAPVHVTPEIAQILRKRRVFRQLEGTTLISAEIEGQRILFTVADPEDRIQKKQSRGKFYEPEELEVIRGAFPPGGVFCDIGANIGNHSVYALRFLGASQTITFEPNPDAYRLLISNLILNDVIDRSDLSLLGLGVAGTSEGGFALAPRSGNLGATRLVRGAGGISTVTVDAALAGRRVDFIKIDVEGMEIDALSGATDTIARCRPPIFVEVATENLDALDHWMDGAGYRIAITSRVFRDNRNLLLAPA